MPSILTTQKRQFDAIMSQVRDKVKVEFVSIKSQSFALSEGYKRADGTAKKSALVTHAEALTIQSRLRRDGLSLGKPRTASFNGGHKIMGFDRVELYEV